MTFAQIEFTPHPSKLEPLMQWGREQIGKTKLPEKEQKLLELALEELLVNLIVHHEEPESLRATLTCRYVPGREVQFELVDNGAPFNPLEYKQGKNHQSIEDLVIGGVGLKLVKKCVDTILYRRENDTNILTIVKTDG